MRKPTRQENEAAGRKAEDYAAMWLRAQGYEILAQRYKTKDGEIDLIARKEGVLACVEVKQRSRARHAQEAVTYSSEQRIMDAAERYFTAHPELIAQNLELRFDILYVIGTVEPPAKPQINHIVDAFRAY